MTPLSLSLLALGIMPELTNLKDAGQPIMRRRSQKKLRKLRRQGRNV